MSWSSRMFLLDTDDALHRLPVSAFHRMLQQDARVRVPAFAGQRVRLASAIVEIADRAVLGVRRLDFDRVEFDADGRLDLQRYGTQQVARLDAMLAGRFTAPAVSPTVVDAANRFTARGGTWSPSPELRRRIEAAACGRLPCRRARVVG